MGERKTRKRVTVGGKWEREKIEKSDNERKKREGNRIEKI
jgi:hypothetical protein